jgi:hypothetical protein
MRGLLKVPVAHEELEGVAERDYGFPAEDQWRSADQLFSMGVPLDDAVIGYGFSGEQPWWTVNGVARIGWACC